MAFMTLGRFAGGLALQEQAWYCKNFKGPLDWITVAHRRLDFCNSIDGALWRLLC